MSLTGLINDFPLLGPFTGWQQKIADGFESAKFGNDWLFRALQENAKASSFIFFRYNKAQSLLSNIAVKGKETVHKILIITFRENFNFWSTAICNPSSGVMLTQLATHPEELLATHLKGMCLGFQDTTLYGMSLNIGSSWSAT